MKISKNRIKEIISEEVEKFKNEYASKVIEENSHPGPNYSPKLGVTLTQFIDDLIDKQLTDVEFVKVGENHKGKKTMIFSTTTPLGNDILTKTWWDNPDVRVIESGNDTRWIIFDVEEGVLDEKWDKDVEVKSTGEHSDMNITELKKEVRKLKKQNDKYQEEGEKVPEKNKKKMGQLLFAVRAKQGWKKGEGSTGV